MKRRVARAGRFGPARWAAVAVALLAAAAIAACGSDSSSTTSTAGGDDSGSTTGTTAASADLSGKAISIIEPGTTFGYWDTEACHAKLRAEALGAEVSYASPPKIDPTAQTQIIQAALLKQPDGMIVDAVNGPAMKPILTSVVNKGVPLVTMGEGTDVPGQVTSVVLDQRDLGAMAAREISEELGGEGTVLILDYQPGVTSTEDRATGFKDAVESDPSLGLRVIGVEFATDSNTAAQKMAAAIRAHPDLGAVFSTNFFGAQGSVSGIQQAGKTGEIKNVTVVGDGPAEFAFVEKGQMDAVILQNAGRVGEAATDIMAEYIGGERDFPQTTYLPSEEGFTLISQDNIDDAASQTAIDAYNGWKCGASK